MQITKEYFDQQFSKLRKDMSQFAKKKDLDRFATKEDLKDFTTKDDLKALAVELRSYTDDVGQSVIAVVDHGFTEMSKELRGKFNDLQEDVNHLTVQMAFTATKQDIKEIKDKLEIISKRDIEDSNLFNRRLVHHDRKFGKIEKEIDKIKSKIKASV
jgi:hypothetical protein